jgi:hypothetical protein
MVIGIFINITRRMGLVKYRKMGREVQAEKNNGQLLIIENQITIGLDFYKADM